MSRHRSLIPPPRMTPPDPAPAPAPAAPQSTATTLTIVQPPPRVGSVTVFADRVEFTNPSIELVESIFLADKSQTRRLAPGRAYVAHGLIVIEELKLALPVGGALIRI